jgi:hypothetical protein
MAALAESAVSERARCDEAIYGGVELSVSKILFACILIKLEIPNIARAEINL